MPAMQHVVLFHFPRDLGPEEDATLRGRVQNLLANIPGIRSCRFGRDVSGRSGPYQYGLVMEFVDEAAAAAYQPHPVHQDVVRWLKEQGADILAFDFPLTAETDFGGSRV
ncbi:MAG: Dabb family protein [Actinomycetia bacterium]|nr:Dabb family protein [Actinomycetes bacterium]